MSGNIKFIIDSAEERANFPTNIKVVGVGGGGCNAVDGMVDAGVEGVEFIAMNTDIQALNFSRASIKMQLGVKAAKGLGVGATPELGMKSAVEEEENIKDMLSGADMIFITCGMGGGTGTGAAPVVAKVAKELGALTVGVVTKPFIFEGGQRMRRANDGIEELRKHLDSIIIIPNQRLTALISDDTSLVDAFKVADDVLRQAIQGISDLITTPGRMNADFADVKAIMSHMGGKAVMGIAMASGNDRAEVATREAMSSPLLEDMSINGAKGVLFNITGGPDIKFNEVSKAAEVIHQAVDPDANIIPGLVLDDKFSGSMTVTIIATGFEESKSTLQEVSVSTEVKALFPRLKEKTRFVKKSPDYITGTNSILAESEDELDKPAYIRRQAD